MPSDLYALRPGNASDVDIIEASWLESMRHGSPHTRGIPSDIFKPRQRATIRRLMERSECLVACLPNDPDVVLGYCVNEPARGESRAVVHFVYVKEKFRHVGIATALVASVTHGAQFSASQYTDALWSIMRRVPGLPVTVNPYLAD